MKTHECQYENCDKQTANPKFCSLSCGAKHSSQLREFIPKQPIVRKCVNSECLKEFSVDKKSDPKKFCSRSCSVSVNNSKRKKIVYCQYSECGKVIDTEHPNMRKYCSSRCDGDDRSKAVVDAWLSGVFDGSTKYGLSRTIRKYLLKQANYKCQSPTCCVPGGWGEINPATGNVPLEVDHIDGDAYNNAFANKNLIVLCPNCHSLTASYRALTEVSSRKWRKNYSQFGNFEEVVEELIDEENFDKI